MSLRHGTGYVSTACFHGLHEECRKTCEFCSEKCICPCEHPVKEFKRPNSCNIHSDCAEAEEKRALSGKKIPSGFHCYSEDCEECFGC